MPEITFEQAITLGMQLQLAGRSQEAEQIYLQILAQQPDNVPALRLRGVILMEAGQLDAGMALIQRAISVNPGDAPSHINLSDGYRRLGDPDKAEQAIRTAIGLNPNEPESHVRLALLLQDNGDINGAIGAFRAAVAVSPDNCRFYHRLLLLLHCHPDSDARSVYEEHRKWNEKFAVPLKQFIKPWKNDRNPDRRLRIGYLSQDFCQQPMAFFIIPLLRNHDRRQVQIVGYGEVARPDMLTDQIRGLCDQWRFTPQMSDEQLAEQITADRIDIMVDLSLHSTPSRLLALARKPAPVQVTYLGYCSTTGMDTIDYRFTDPHLDPPGPDVDLHYSERSVHLPEAYWCYQPLVDPPLAPVPATRNGFITFGCLNNFIKVSPPALAMFCRVMKSVPNSRLILHAQPGKHRQRVGEELRSQGIDPARLQFAGYLPLHEYLNVYQQIDIALDPFPSGGGTTTLDAIWMGLPVVTLRGNLAVGRGGASILSNVGLQDLIAKTPEEYATLATNLAADIPRLMQLRKTLRPTMQNSPLMNAPRFARNVELAYRRMWRNYCMTANRQGRQGQPALPDA